MDKRAAGYPVLRPDLQISFFQRLKLVRGLYLDDSLGNTVRKCKLEEIDTQLREFISEESLIIVASHGIRGEVFFPVPVLIEANPHVLGYYRLLYGFSQKEFYSKGPFGRFKCFEETGRIPPATSSLVSSLCRSLADTGAILVSGLDVLSLSIVHDLQLLTLGPQFRGSQNTRLGQDATRIVFELIKEIVSSNVRGETATGFTLENDSGRTVLVAFSSDPDIAIEQILETGRRPVVSIEIKGGGDVSNIHNRLGEAEKSHLKAKSKGYLEFWTIVRSIVSPAIARRDTPTTSHFFHLDEITRRFSPEWAAFRDMLCSRLGIRTPPSDKPL